MLNQSLLLGVAAVTWSLAPLPAADVPNTGMGDPAALISAFDRYQATLSADSAQLLVMSLGTLRGITSPGFNAAGTVQINLKTALVTSSINGLPADSAFDLWLVQNQAASGDSTLAESTDLLVKVGSYQVQSKSHMLSATLPADALKGGIPDRAFVVRANQNPVNAFVLTGSATLFDRLLHRQVRLVSDTGSTTGFDPSASAGRTSNFARLVARGRQVFVNEKFDGNGRACGTCHVESNNFTIDPAFIARLPRTDPLFVAETNQSLAGDFEKPELTRSLGLILENADGFDDLGNKFTMRSVQTVLALRNSTIRPDPSFGIDFTSNGRNADPSERLGWGNDGPPLRDFSIVAITQHATKTLQRKPGTDFRVPTDEELDALAAYQLALGRQEDFDLPSLSLKSTQASTGKTLFLDTGNIGEPGHKNCNACHFNAGGTTGISFNSKTPGFSPRLDGNPRGFNMAAPINVSETPLALSLHLPRDGGFGTLATPLGGFGNFADTPIGALPVEEFNSPSLVEAADTAPFFHNHTVPDLESAVAFYGSDAFMHSPSSIGGPNGVIFVKISPDPNDSEVQAIAAFLRVLNALENIRSSIALTARATAMAEEEDIRDLARLAIAETNDAWTVLAGGALSGSTEPDLLSAREHLLAARLWLQFAAYAGRRPLIDVALSQSSVSLRAARSALAETSTLPPSYRQ